MKRKFHFIISSFKGMPRNLRSYWANLMNSTQRKLSSGAQKIAKIIPYARSENWRRKDKR